MERIALIIGNTVIYWRSFLVAAGVLTAVFLFFALYPRQRRDYAAACVLSVLSLFLGLLLARLLHWYCRADSYPGFSSAIVHLSVGDFALLGAFAGCLLAGTLLRLTGILQNLPRALDCASLAGCAGIAVGRLASFFDASDRGPIVNSVKHLPWIYPITNSATGTVEYRLATFLLQAMAAGLLFAILLTFHLTRRKQRPDGDTCLLFVLLYSATQVVLDSTRYDSLYFRSNGFVSIEQVIGAVAIVFVVSLFSVRLVRGKGLRPWVIPVWLLIAAALGLAGYMEYHVQRHPGEAIFAYSVMSACLLAVIASALLLRHGSLLPPKAASSGGRYLKQAAKDTWDEYDC